MNTATTRKNPMKNQTLFTLGLLAAAALAGCAGMPASNARLEQARVDYRSVQADPRALEHSGAEARLAAEALAKADAAWRADESEGRVNHLAYLSTQQSATARATMDKLSARAMVDSASAERDKIQLAARTREADAAQKSASQARGDAAVAQADAAAAQRSAEMARADTLQAQLQSQLIADRNRQLLDQLKDLDARSTPRGLVISLEDVLFDTDKAALRPAGLSKVGRLAQVLKNNGQRRVLIEGFTDSTGSASYNQALSGERAEAVRGALLGQGIAMERVSARAYGESAPVADNATAAGRQMNRRVEIVLSDDSGNIIPR
jgi:outer membrane protein OmpA-like peptidoglycan-associated protein